MTGASLKIIVSLAEVGETWKGTIDIPQQGASGLPLMNLRVEHPAVHFELAAGPGRLASFDGVLAEDTVSGTFEQAGVKGTFRMKRATPPVPAAPAPPPYREEEVTVAHGNVSLACTLTFPESRGPHPAVALITGSGAQNRDEELFGFKPFRIIADHLTRQGVAVLRCDDRGIGGSRGNVAEATSSDFADDAVAQAEYLAARPEIDKRRVGLLGHSEGGIIAPIAAGRSKEVGFVILLSGPAVTGERILLAQAELLSRAAGATEEMIARNRVLQLKTFETVRSGKGWDDLAATIRAEAAESIAKLPEAQRKAIEDPASIAATQVESQLMVARSPWFRFFLDYDPAPALANLKVPALAIFGELDLQVPAEMNRAVMSKALAGNPHHRVEVLPRANHLYQEAKTGGIAEYPVLEKKFVSGLLPLISEWILSLGT
ncbi:MAG: alpha/beta hydrolase family protein [Vicinamibacterales bacterium]